MMKYTQPIEARSSISRSKTKSKGSFPACFAASATRMPSYFRFGDTGSLVPPRVRPIAASCTLCQVPADW